MRINEELTDRELEIFGLFIEGYTGKEIADKLFISHYTVMSHSENIQRKAEARNMRQAINNLVVKPLQEKITKLETRTNEKSLPFIIDNCTNKRSSVLSKAGYDQPRY